MYVSDQERARRRDADECFKLGHEPDSCRNKSVMVVWQAYWEYGEEYTTCLYVYKDRALKHLNMACRRHDEHDPDIRGQYCGLIELQVFTKE